MNELLKQIKELEVKSKETDYWKGRYEEQALKIKEAISMLTEISGVKVARKDNKISLTYEQMAEELYAKMKADDTLYIGTNDLVRFLGEKGLSAHNPEACKLRALIQAKKGIMARNEGRNKFLYYQKPAEPEDRIKFGKVSFMG